jgi:hypothetical protein
VQGNKSGSCDASLFTQANAMDILGVGSKMVKAIRFYGCRPRPHTGTARHRQTPASPDERILAIIAQNDPYFEDFLRFGCSIADRRQQGAVRGLNLFFNNATPMTLQRMTS